MPHSPDDPIPGFLSELAALGAQAALPYFRVPLTVENKSRSGYDPVTVADRAVETALRSAIRARFPTHGILGEEFGADAGTSPRQWVIDPIDGTRAFVAGLPTWGTLVGLCEGGVPRYGLMSQPYVGECFVGYPGGAYCLRDGRQTTLRAAGAASLAEATLFATAPEMFAPGLEATAFARLRTQVRLTRFGADCYAYCLLAAGHVDLVVEAGLGFYDIAALVPIVEGAGGVISDWHGAPVRDGGRVIAAATRELHAAARACLAADA